MGETWLQSLSWKDSPEKGKATHISIQLNSDTINLEIASDPKALFQLAVSFYSAGKEQLRCWEKHILPGQDSPRVLIKPPGHGK